VQVEMSVEFHLESRADEKAIDVTRGYFVEAITTTSPGLRYQLCRYYILILGRRLLSVAGTGSDSKECFAGPLLNSRHQTASKLGRRQ
jgi:hypothetical protein